MQIVYAQQDFPDPHIPSLFLMGPTPRAEHPVPSWRPEAIRLLEEGGFEGVVYVPETEDGTWQHSYIDQVEWEYKGLCRASVILAWIPRDLTTLPGFTTNVEFGRWVTSGKIIMGHPQDAPKTKYLDWLLDKETGKGWFPTLEETVQAAILAL